LAAVTKRVLEYWTPTVVWLLAIFFFSTDQFSATNTAQVILPVLTFFFPGLSLQDFDVWHFVIRKLGHITEYFLLALLAYRCLKQEQSDPLQARVRTLSFVLLAAALDEIHQGMTAFRTPSPLDVGYDCLGAVWALWLTTSYETRRLRTYSIL
jgi:VanZ family protein